MRWTEIATGVAVGVFLFLYWQGVNVVPVLVLLGLAAVLYSSGAFRGGGKSFAVISGKNSEQKLIDFDDIGGQEVAKNELREALDFIANEKLAQNLGIRPMKGILLNGPPGTGKTLLAKAAACYTNSAFVSASGSEFVEMYVGVGAQRVRQLFKKARDLARQDKKNSAVIFIDEIEVLGGKRGQHNGNMEYDQTLNELLVQMDGLSGEDAVRCLVIGATNRNDMLDQALLRPGRFDRQVRVDLPDKNGRMHILKLHTRNKPLAPDVSLAEIAKDTFGFSGAHLESVANEAAIMALREKTDMIFMRHLRSAVDKVMLGEKVDRIPVAEEKRRVAVHEAGHGLVSEITRPGSVAVITVSPRNNALGYVRQTQEDDTYLFTFSHFRQKIAVALAGAVAEEIMLGNRSTGASGDFKQAVDLAKQIIFAGMSELGIVLPDDISKDRLHSAVSGILKEVETFVQGILTENRLALMSIVDRLLEEETLSGDEFRSFIR